MFDLENRVIIVTGGNRGIGDAIVKALEVIGAKVAYINNTSQGNSKSLHIKADVTSLPEMEKAMKIVESELGDIYGVVCNAGIIRDGFLHKSTMQQWNDVIDVNLNGVYNTVRPIINKLYQRKKGSVVFISSIVGESGNLGQTNYAASKAAIIGFAKSLAKEAARHNVRSNVVAPGFTNTSMTSNIPETVKKKIIADIPLGRFAEAEEIAWVVVFLLSPKFSSYITGEVVRVNGGLLM
jgi:acetoacetyl-CoA reductase/3-oxoacyl-[acyl-carrier protein] reductase